MSRSSVLILPEYAKVRWWFTVGLLTVISLLLATGANAESLKLNIDNVRGKALEFNRGYLSAKEEITKADGEVTKARAGALPTINASGLYTYNFDISKYG